MKKSLLANYLRKPTVEDQKPVHPYYRCQNILRRIVWLVSFGLSVLIIYLSFITFFEVKAFRDGYFFLIREEESKKGFYIDRSPDGWELWRTGIAADGLPYDYRIWP